MVPTMPPLVTTLSPVFNFSEHLRRLFALPLHRPKEQKIKYSEDEENGEKSHQGVGGRRRLKEQIENHVINQFKPIARYSASGEAERTHLKYSGNEPHLIACLISRMMSRYRCML